VDDLSYLYTIGDAAISVDCFISECSCMPKNDLGLPRARDPECLRVQEVAPGHIFCCLMLGNESEPARNENLGHSIAYHNSQYKSPSCFVLRRRAMSSEGPGGGYSVLWNISQPFSDQPNVILRFDRLSEHVAPWFVTVPL
jgi:hypothetical protein